MHRMQKETLCAFMIQVDITVLQVVKNLVFCARVIHHHQCVTAADDADHLRILMMKMDKLARLESGNHPKESSKVLVAVVPSLQCPGCVTSEYFHEIYSTVHYGPCYVLSCVWKSVVRLIEVMCVQVGRSSSCQL